MNRTPETKTIEQDAIYESLKTSRFKQQNLPALRPVPTLTSTLIIFCSIGVFCISLGIVLLVYSNKSIEVITRYDEDCGTTNPCFLNITLNDTMKAPITIHYQLNNFYQNHRKIINVYSVDQLKGANLTIEQLNKTQECGPYLLNQDMSKSWSHNGENLDPEALAIPCGIMPMSFFSDSFNLYYPNETEILIDEKNISWPEDKKKYKNIESKDDPQYWEYVQWLDMTNEHFIVWMRPAAYPNFRKLWGRIREDIPNGTYLLHINNTFDASLFNGEKYFIMSTMNMFGSKNYVLAYGYLIAGGVSFILAIAFFVWNITHKKIRIKL